MSEELANKVKQLIAEKLDVDPAKVVDDARFIDDFGADSLDTVELVMALEEEFGLEIPGEDGQKIMTVKDAIDYIKNKCEGQ